MSSRYSITLVMAMVFAVTPAVSQTARLQVIHNAADPGAAVVDVYVEEVSTALPFINDFAFRTATPFQDVPAGTELTITIAPGSSSGAGDGIASFSYLLAEGGTYQLIANGVLNPDNFEANPSGEDIGFTLLANAAGQEDSDTAGEIQFNVVHGVTDAPAVDVIARDVATLVDGAVYGDITGYVGVPRGRYLLDVTPDEDNATIVATVEADFTTLPDTALTVLASGFLTPNNDQNGPAFGLLAVAPDGNAFLLPAPSEARVQIIHNAADPAAAVVDIYSGGKLLLDDFAFRTATPFISVLANQDLDLVIAPGNSSSALDGVFGQSLVLDPGGTYQVIANGVLDPGQFAANPDGESITFELFVNDAAQEASINPGSVLLNVVHGSTDAPTVDVVARDVAALVDDASYGDITDYLMVAPAAYTLDVRTADGSATAATFLADLSGAAGGVLTVVASGFFSPSDDQGGEPFGLLAVFPDGMTLLLPAGAVSNEEGGVAPTFELSGVYPNPFSTTAAVQFSLAADARVGLEVYDVLGRRVLRVAPEVRPAGAGQIALDAERLPSGAYFYRLIAETPTERIATSGRMTVVR